MWWLLPTWGGGGQPGQPMPGVRASGAEQKATTAPERSTSAFPSARRFHSTPDGNACDRRTDTGRVERLGPVTELWGLLVDKKALVHRWPFPHSLKPQDEAVPRTS